MPICVNALLKWRHDNESVIVDRILWMDNQKAVLIRITGPNTLPEARSLVEIEDAVEFGDCEIVQEDTYTKPNGNTITQKHLERRNAAWDAIAPIVEAPEGGAFDPTVRGKLIREAHRLTGKTKRLIRIYLFRYWRGGQTKNALLPWYDMCGGKGKERVPRESKRGRPNLMRKAIGQSVGINIGPEERDKFSRGIRKFYENKKTGPKHSLKEVYELTLSEYFCISYKTTHDKLTPVLPSNDQLPTLRQFKYWYYKQRDHRTSLIAREGQRRYNLKRRGITGDSTKMAVGPGSVFQIDSTTADLYLVSSLDRSRIIGRPVLYLVVDVFSRMIVGFYLSIENAGYLPAAMAIENAASDKVEFCKKYDIDISPDDWPSQHLPEMVIADRGELEGPKADPIISGLGIKLSNTPPYRADLKGIVERSFRTINDELVHWAPGYVEKPRERGDRDYRLDAVLDLRQFTQMVIHFVLHHNQSLLTHYRLDEFMIGDQVESRPTVLWHWGVKNRTGHLRTMDPLQLRMNLLPAAESTVTPRGIRFKGAYYSCETAVREQWFSRARTFGNWNIDVGYDPRTTDYWYLRRQDSGRSEVCRVLEADERFKGRPWIEIESFVHLQKERELLAASDDTQAKLLYRTKVAAIVAEATEQTEAGQKRQSKQAKVGGIRENRKAARETYRHSNATMATLASSGQAAEIVKMPEATTENDHYTAAPDNMEMLKKQREEKWNQQ